MQESKMAAAAIWKLVKRNNSAIFERIHTKFNIDTENKVPELVSVAKLISHKIKMAATATL